MLAVEGSPRTGGWWLAPLAIAQIVSWGVLYYATLVAASRISIATGWSLPLVTGLFAGGLVVSAIAGIWAGRLLDRRGPRAIMTSGSILGTIGFVVVATAQHPAVFALGWLITGTAHSAVLYQAVFTVVIRRYGDRRRTPLTIITLAGGLASTIFAPITAALISAFDWRVAFLILAAVNAVVTIPAHWLFLEPRWDRAPTGAVDRPQHTVRTVLRTRRFWFLELATVAMAVALFSVTLSAIPLFEEKGMGFELAAFAFGLIGAGQIVGRLLFVALPRTVAPWIPLATVGVLTAACFALLGWLPGPTWAVVAIGVVAGAIRGAQTLVNASAVADRWGTENYGAINGVFAMPITIVGALTPAIGPIIAAGAGSYAMVAFIMAGVALLGALLARGS